MLIAVPAAAVINPNRYRADVWQPWKTEQHDQLTRTELPMAQTDAVDRISNSWLTEPNERAVNFCKVFLSVQPQQIQLRMRS